MKMPRMIATDLDGTMMCDVCTVPTRNRDAVARAREAGCLYVVSTGRSRNIVPISQLPPVDYLLCDNGAVIYNGQTGEIVHEHCMTDEEVLGLMDAVCHLPVCFEVFTHGELLTDYATAELIKEDPFHVWYYKEGIAPFVDDLRAYIKAGGGKITKLNVILLDMAAYEEAGRILHAKEGFDIAHSKDWYEVTAAGMSKGPMLVRLCEMLGVDPQDVMAFGDSANDVSMLSAVGCGVAMGNATQTAIDAARYVAADAKDAGVAAFLEEQLGL